MKECRHSNGIKVSVPQDTRTAHNKYYVHKMCQQDRFFIQLCTITQSSISIPLCEHFIHVSFHGAEFRASLSMILSGHAQYVPFILGAKYKSKKGKGINTVLLTFWTAFSRHSSICIRIYIRLSEKEMTMWNFINTVNGLMNFYDHYKTIHPFFMLRAVQCFAPSEVRNSIELHVLLTHHLQCAYIFQTILMHSILNAIKRYSMEGIVKKTRSICINLIFSSILWLCVCVCKKNVLTS